MHALQYILTLLATICEGEYFRRNDKVQGYIEAYFEEFANAAEVEIGLLTTVNFIDSLGLIKGSYWFNKSNIFTLIVEINKIDVSSVDAALLKSKLDELEHQNNQYILALNEGKISGLPVDNTKYFDLAKEAVNDKSARDYRGQFVGNILRDSMTSPSS
jgi:hypothetical protein